jgi:hypothetical protein
MCLPAATMYDERNLFLTEAFTTLLNQTYVYTIAISRTSGYWHSSQEGPSLTQSSVLNNFHVANQAFQKFDHGFTIGFRTHVSTIWTCVQVPSYRVQERSGQSWPSTMHRARYGFDPWFQVTPPSPMSTPSSYSRIHTTTPVKAVKAVDMVSTHRRARKEDDVRFWRRRTEEATGWQATLVDPQGISYLKKKTTFKKRCHLDPLLPAYHEVQGSLFWPETLWHV